MKKEYFLLLIILIIGGNLLFSQSEDDIYIINDIDLKFVGYYISIDFMETFEETKNYGIARDNNSEYQYYAHIIVRENGIEYYPFNSDCYFEVSNDEYKDFVFQYISADEIIIIEPNGKKYKQMTNLYGWENYMAVMNNYLGNIILADQIKNRDIIIDNNFIIIPSLNNKIMEIDTWQSYEDKEINLILINYEFGHKWTVFLKINSDKLTIHYSYPFWNNNERFYLIWEKEL